MTACEISSKGPEAIRASFEANGFVLVRSFFSRERIAEVHPQLDRYITTIVPALATADIIYEKNGSAIRNLFRMDRHEPFFDDFGNDPSVLRIADTLVNGKAVLRAVQTFNKPAKVGSPVPQHQDNAYFCLSPPDSFTMWVALDPATEENGPVHYLPGSHRLGSLEHTFSGQPGNSLKMKNPRPIERNEVFRALMEPGDVIFHHCRTIHFSGPNTSDTPRVGMVLPYTGSHVGPDDALKKTYESVSAKVGRPLYH